jgi:hypothetical protein
VPFAIVGFLFFGLATIRQATRKNMNFIGKVAMLFGLFLLFVLSPHCPRLKTCRCYPSSLQKTGPGCVLRLFQGSENFRFEEHARFKLSF